MKRLRTFLRFARYRIDWSWVATIAFMLVYLGVFFYALATRNILIGQILFVTGMSMSALILIKMFVSASVRWTRGFMQDFEIYEKHVESNRNETR